MKKIYLVITLLSLFFHFSHAQDSVARHIKWSFDGKKTSQPGIYQLSLKGQIEDGWRLFSTTASDEELHSRIVPDSATAVQASIKQVKEEGDLQVKKEPLLDNLEIRYFEKEVTLQVTISVAGSLRSIRGAVSYMMMKGDEVTSPVNAPFFFSIDTQGNITTGKGGLQESAEALNALKRPAIELNKPVANCGGTGLEDSANKSLWGIFVLGFIGGLIGLLTPCVFPMIPLTVSFFTKKSPNRKRGIGNALLYGFFILLIYVLLSVPFHFLDSSNPEILNTISTNVWLNLFFFVIFVIFSLSFFGLFEITMPSSLANKADERAGVGGVLGIFFMALTLALVSFSCTGPILGSLLAGSLSTNGGAIQLTMGMAGFGLALALPFAVFAMFPNLLKSMPKSGGWLTSVKIVLGFLELGFAIKFFSNADLVEHWGILKREVFFAIWIIIGLLLTLYLFGIIRFKHEGPVKLTRLRILFGVVALAFTLYLVPGVTKTPYANRKLISGFPPPFSYSIYKDAYKGVEANVINDYPRALRLAKAQGKPILIDFTGWACVNCRKMEENVWIVPEVSKLITDHFILVSLYVDDRAKLPPEQQFVYTLPDGSKKSVLTVGNKYATFQNVNFAAVSQPFYAIIGPDEKLLTRPVGYTPNEKKYADWLKCGIEAMKKVK